MPKIKDMYAVILAGGSGERFWPMSTTSRPKQFLPIPAGKPLICATVERIEKLIPGEQIFIITRRDLADMVHRVLPGFPKQNIIGEPCGRDTAAAVALGAGLVKNRNPNAAFCVLTSDHLIEKNDVFRKTLEEAFQVALSSDVLVTIGIKPSFPSTGFGYVETERKLEGKFKTVFRKVRRFVEKPDKATAVKYLKTGRFYWNSGMFVWSVSALAAAIAKYRPQLAGLVNRVAEASSRRSLENILRKEYARLEKISIDYAVMEKAGNIIMAESRFIWDDVGSWSALEAHCAKDTHDNVIIGRGEVLDACGNIVVAEDGMLALVGVRDLIVVRSGAATLVCAKNKAQEIKKLVARMKSGGKYKGIV